MKHEEFILSILRKIESLSSGTIAYAYITGNAPMTHKWWEIAYSDVDMYLHDKRFKTLTAAWHKAAKARGLKIIFVGCKPSEEKLAKLLEENCLIMNIE